MITILKTKILFLNKTYRVFGLTAIILLTSLCFYAQKTIPPTKIVKGQSVDIKSDALTDNFLAYDIFSIPMDEVVELKRGVNQFNFVLELGDKYTWDLNLVNSGLLGPKYREIIGTANGPVVLPPRENISFHGYLNSSSDGIVAMTIDNDWMMGFVTTPDGDRLYIEPLTYVVHDAPINHFLVYKSGDIVQDANVTCGAIEAENRAPSIDEHDWHIDNPGTTESVVMACLEVDFSIASTNDMINPAHNTAPLVMNHVVSITTMMQAYYSFHPIQYVINDNYVAANAAADPLMPNSASSNVDILLPNFMAWAQGGGVFGNHDLGQMWTNRDIVGCGDPNNPPTNTGLIGCAYIGAVCGNFRYNVCEDFAPANLGCTAILSAHEIGHNFDALHSDAGVAPSNIMNGSINCGATGFGPNSMVKITNYAESADGSCLAACGIPNNDLCANAIPIACGAGVTVDISNATGTDNPGTCVTFGSNEPGYWYTVDGTGGNINITTCNPGTNYDSKITVWSGACGALNCITGNDDQLGGFDPACDVTGIGFNRGSTVDFCSENGTTYYIYLYGFAGAVGIAEMTVTCDPVATITCPNPGTFDCGDDAGITAWLNSPIINNNNCVTLSNNYNPADFDKCVTTTNNITFSLTNPAGQVIADCVVALTINAAPAPFPAQILFLNPITCVEADAFLAPNLPYSNNLAPPCLISGTLPPVVNNNWDACGGTITITYSGQDECGNQLNSGPHIITVLPAPVPTITPPVVASPISCVDADNFVAPDATYTNGLVGTCNISGTIPAGVDNFWDACGGTIVLHYFTFDQCGNYITIPPIVIDVNPAPIPTITLPALPTSLSCAAAASFVPPLASVDNGLPGACNLSGTASAVMNHFYDACGGELQIIYLGEDDCGRPLLKNVAIIPVDPAPVPAIDIPNTPTSLSCSDAQSYQAPITTYDNGLDGDCNISGLILPVVTYNVDECDGGTMTIHYNSTDDCGNALIANPIVIQVEPASIPVLKSPGYVPATIFCWDAAYGYSPGNATYTNGETGFCENSGEIAPGVTEIWNTCDGGFIVYNYSGYDNCGNELTPIIIKVAVLPDTWAPDGACAPYEETMLSIEDVPEPDGLDYYFGQVAVGYFEYCSEVIVTVIDDTGTPQCSGEGFFERVYTVEISDACGNIGGTCTITFSGNCNDSYCTLGQKFYGNPNSDFNGQSSGNIIKTLLDNGANPIVIGDGTDCGFIIDETQCVQEMLTSYGEAISLPAGYALGCSDTHNQLINQMVTTILNIRYNESLNPAGSLDFGEFALSAACMNIPGWMLAELPDNPTVNDMLEYANNFMACQCSNTCGNFQPNMAELTNLFWGLNSRFNKCHVPGPCGNNFFDPSNNGNTPVLTIHTLELYPNPTNEVINLNVAEFFGLPAVVEIFDTRGSKLGEKTYQSIEQNILEFDVKKFASGMYWLSIKVEGHKLITKKFIVSRWR